MRVDIEGRTFFAKIDTSGAVLLIIERKLWSAGTIYEQWIDTPYWHRSHGRPKRGRVARIFREIERSLP